ncbi:hypothetical protein [Niveibacterium sp.]|uniref:hypothetical protein n=1 Tax=Niveibacterium sp. TaxID=2017444 RepID=UPI0035B1C47F
MADLINSVTSTALNTSGVQRAAAAALAQPLASSAIRNDLVEVSPGLLNTGIIGAIDPGYFRPTAPVALSHVQPGELITATLMNAIIDRLNALAGATTGATVLAGDVTGAASQTVVERLRKVPVADQTPSEGQVLGYANGAWRPTAPQTQSGPKVVAGGRLVGSHPQGASTLTVVASYLGNLQVTERRYIRFDGFDPAANDYFVQVTYFRAGDTYNMPVLESVSDKGITIAFFDPSRKWIDLGDASQIDIQITAYPRTILTNILPGLLASGVLTVNPGVLAALNANAAGAASAPGASATPAVTISPELLGALNNLAISTRPAVSAAGLADLATPLAAAPGAGVGPAAGVSIVAERPAATIAIRSAPAKKKSPARAVPAKPVPKRAAPKKPAPKGG